MSKFSDDLVTDSIPDAPRDPESLRDTSLPCNRDEVKKDTQKTKVEPDEGVHGQDSPPKTRNKPKSPKLPPFIGSNTIPSFLSSGSAGVVCISNAGSVHVGPSLNISYGAPTRDRSRGKDRSRSPRPSSQSQHLQEILGSQSAVSLDELDVAAEHVGRRWETLGSLLDFSQGQMERLHDEHRHISLKEVVYQLLLEWRQNKGKDASVGTLCQALWDAEEWDAAERLAKAHATLVYFGESGYEQSTSVSCYV